LFIRLKTSVLKRVGVENGRILLRRYKRVCDRLCSLYSRSIVPIRDKPHLRDFTIIQHTPRQTHSEIRAGTVFTGARRIKSGESVRRPVSLRRLTRYPKTSCRRVPRSPQWPSAGRSHYRQSCEMKTPPQRDVQMERVARLLGFCHFPRGRNFDG